MSSFEASSKLHKAAAFVPSAVANDSFVPNHLYGGAASDDGDDYDRSRAGQEAQWAALEAFRAAAYRAGEQAGREDASRRLDGVAEAIESAAELLDLQRSEYLQAHRRATLDLAFAIGRHVIGREIEANPDLLVDRIDQAIALLSDDESVLVQMNPEQYAALVEDASPAFTRMSTAGTFRIEASVDLARDDIRVTSGATSVDARVEKMLEGLRSELSTLVQLDPAAVEPSE